MEKNIYETIKNIENLCNEKLDRYNDLYEVFKKERKAAVSADMTVLWATSREKQDIAEEIRKLQQKIMNEAANAELVIFENIDNYSLNRILSNLPADSRKEILAVSLKLSGIKQKISAIAHENRAVIDEGLKTVEDLLSIVTDSCLREERYGRETYTRSGGYSQRMTVMRGGL